MTQDSFSEKNSKRATFYHFGVLSENVNNLIILIRLSLYFFIVLVVFLLNIILGYEMAFFVDFEYFRITDAFFFNIGILIAFFSLIVFFAVKFIPQKILFYMQAAFDFFIVSYLVVETDFIESPFLVLYALIVIYMSFFDGIKGGVTAILSFVIFMVYSFIYFDFLKEINISKYDFTFSIIQYCLVFVIVLFLSHFLHKKYVKKEQETRFYENKLRELENIHELVVENINIGIFVLNSAGSIISCNNTSLEIIDATEKEILGRKVKDVIPGAEDNENIIFFNKKYIGYKYQKFMHQNRHNLGYLFIFQDVTERENLKSELSEKEKLAFLGEFAAVVAHEIKNPLGAIKGSFYLLQKKYDSNDRLVSIVNREISRLELALNNLLFVTKNRHYDSGNFSVSNILGNADSAESHLFSEIIREFGEYIKDFQRFEGILFDYNILSDFKLPFSREEFYQIFWNLVLNSYESKSDCSITVRSKRLKNTVKVDYMDNGHGLSEEVRKNIGTPFYTTKKSGTGLGIYVIKSILDKYSILYKIFTSAESETGGFQMCFYINVEEL